MHQGSVSGRLLAVSCIAVVVLGTASGAALTATYFSDREQTTVSIGAASDFTVDISSALFSPATVETDDNGTIEVLVTVPNRSEVDLSRFSLSPATVNESVSAEGATCVAPDGGWNCTVTFDTQSVVDLAGTGNHALVLRGWWTYNRDFEATGQLSVINSTENQTFSTTLQTVSDSDQTNTTTRDNETTISPVKNNTTIDSGTVTNNTTGTDEDSLSPAKNTSVTDEGDDVSSMSNNTTTADGDDVPSISNNTTTTDGDGTPSASNNTTTTDGEDAPSTSNNTTTTDGEDAPSTSNNTTTTDDSEPLPTANNTTETGEGNVSSSVNNTTETNGGDTPTTNNTSTTDSETDVTITIDTDHNQTTDSCTTNETSGLCGEITISARQSPSAAARTAIEAPSHRRS